MNKQDCSITKPTISIHDIEDASVSYRFRYNNSFCEVLHRCQTTQLHPDEQYRCYIIKWYGGDYFGVKYKSLNVTGTWYISQDREQKINITRNQRGTTVFELSYIREQPSGLLGQEKLIEMAIAIYDHYMTLDDLNNFGQFRYPIDD